MVCRAFTFAVLLATASVSAAELTRGPFLQQTQTTSTRIVVRTDVPTQVQSVATGGGRTVESQKTDGVEHVTRLTELTAGTEYSYVVKVNGAVVAGPYKFKTPGAARTVAGR